MFSESAISPPTPVPHTPRPYFKKNTDPFPWDFECISSDCPYCSSGPLKYNSIYTKQKELAISPNSCSLMRCLAQLSKNLKQTPLNSVYFLNFQGHSWDIGFLPDLTGKSQYQNIHELLKFINPWSWLFGFFFPLTWMTLSILIRLFVSFHKNMWRWCLFVSPV